MMKETGGPMGKKKTTTEIVKKRFSDTGNGAERGTEGGRERERGGGREGERERGRGRERK